MDAFCRRYLGLSATSMAMAVALGFHLGAAVELFMIKVYIKDTNFYEVAKKKEVQRRENPSNWQKFGEEVKRQIEERKAGREPISFEERHAQLLQAEKPKS